MQECLICSLDKHRILNLITFFSAHDGSVRGVAIDNLNQVVVTAGADSCILFWKFKSRDVMETMILPAQIARLLLHRERLDYKFVL